MKISTKGRYALRLMCDIAMNQSENPIPLKEIAERQDISVKYLEQIVIILSRAGFLKSIRGAQGGYKLVNSPDFYTVGMILRLTEGSLAPVSCLDDEINKCPRASDCQTLFVWEKIYKAVNDIIDNITVQDIIENKSGNYSI